MLQYLKQFTYKKYHYLDSITSTNHDKLVFKSIRFAKRNIEFSIMSKRVFTIHIGSG